MSNYVVYIPKKNSYKKPREASKAEKYWRLYMGPLDEIQVRYASGRGTFPMPDTADRCLWLDVAIIPLVPGMYIIRMGEKKNTYWKYNGNTLVLELEFDATGVKWKPNKHLGKIRGSYDRCIHSTKRKEPSWRVLPSCPSPEKNRMGNRWHLARREICESCPDYQFDRAYIAKK